MTRQRSFKRLVRLRMEKTGERYAAARAALLAANETGAAEAPVLTVSDEVIRCRTGRGWEEWFDLLDERSGSDSRSSSGAARWSKNTPWKLAAIHAGDWLPETPSLPFARRRACRF